MANQNYVMGHIVANWLIEGREELEIVIFTETQDIPGGPKKVSIFDPYYNGGSNIDTFFGPPGIDSYFGTLFEPLIQGRPTQVGLYQQNLSKTD